MVLLLLHTKNQLLFMSSWSKCEIPRLRLASTRALSQQAVSDPKPNSAKDSYWPRVC